MAMTDKTETEFIIGSKFSNTRRDLIIHNREVPLFKARLASMLIERWGLVAAMPDGEDSSGREKLRKLTPGELVDEACQTADIAVEKFRSLGWMLELPELAGLESEDKS